MSSVACFFIQYRHGYESLYHTRKNEQFTLHDLFRIELILRLFLDQLDDLRIHIARSDEGVVVALINGATANAFKIG
jgi:hypothetical protein